MLVVEDGHTTTVLISDRVGESGKVIGLDIDEDNVNEYKKKFELYREKNRHSSFWRNFYDTGPNRLFIWFCIFKVFYSNTWFILKRLLREYQNSNCNKGDNDNRGTG